MNTDYNVISMCAEAIEAVLPKETCVKFAIWIKVEKLDVVPTLLQRTPSKLPTFPSKRSAGFG